jgi:hypothetical protein
VESKKPQREDFLSKLFQTDGPKHKQTFSRYIYQTQFSATDGYPSYPSVAENLHFEHQIVTHAEGFVNSFGQSTKLIENLWLHMKTEIKS